MYAIRSYYDRQACGTGQIGNEGEEERADDRGELTADSVEGEELGALSGGDEGGIEGAADRLQAAEDEGDDEAEQPELPPLLHGVCIDRHGDEQDQAAEDGSYNFV